MINEYSVNSFESCGTVDGPGIRCVIFLNQCFLRCKYCHNPETWHMHGKNYNLDELIKKVVRFKPYFKNGGGVTLSGGEPLLHTSSLVKLCKRLKEEGINVAIDTAGYGLGGYEDILKYVDLIIFDIKDITRERFYNLTSGDISNVWEFLEVANRLNKKFWIRQVIVPGLHDNYEFLVDLNKYIHERINVNNIKKIEFLPYHKLGSEKYEKLGIKNPYKDMPAMDIQKCNELFNQFMVIYNEK